MHPAALHNPPETAFCTRGSQVIVAWCGCLWAADTGIEQPKESQIGSPGQDSGLAGCADEWAVSAGDEIPVVLDRRLKGHEGTRLQGLRSTGRTTLELPKLLWSPWGRISECHIDGLSCCP